MKNQYGSVNHPNSNSSDHPESLRNFSSTNGHGSAYHTDSSRESDEETLEDSIPLLELERSRELSQIFCTTITRAFAPVCLRLSHRNYEAELTELAQLAAPIGKGFLEGGIDGTSAFNTVEAIAVGTSVTLDHDTGEGTARYAMPTIAVMGAAAAFLEEHYERHRMDVTRVHQLEKIEQILRLWKAFSHDIRMASFVLPLFFFVVSSLIELYNHIKGHPEAQVNIKDGWAALIMAGCFAISTAEGIKTYYDELYKRYPGLQQAHANSRFARVFTHLYLRRALAALDGASTVHWLIMACEGVFGASQGLIEKILRYSITLVAGVVAGIWHHAPADTGRWYYKLLDWGLLTAKALSLTLSTYTTFQDEEAWGETTVRMQLYFWVVAFPLYVVSMGLLTHQVYKKLQHDRRSFNPEPQAPFAQDDQPMPPPGPNAVPMQHYNMGNTAIAVSPGMGTYSSHSPASTEIRSAALASPSQLRFTGSTTSTSSRGSPPLSPRERAIQTRPMS